MHTRHGLCHDDVKLRNILASPPLAEHRHHGPGGAPGDTITGMAWYLADFNEARHVAHPYHSSRLWVRINRQLPDCRANDVRRLVKSYLQFLRACLPRELVPRFDEALLAGRQPLSRMYWASIMSTNRAGAPTRRTGPIAKAVRELSEKFTTEMGTCAGLSKDVVVGMSAPSRFEEAA